MRQQAGTLALADAAAASKGASLTARAPIRMRAIRASPHEVQRRTAATAAATARVAAALPSSAAAVLPATRAAAPAALEPAAVAALAAVVDGCSLRRLRAWAHMVWTVRRPTTLSIITGTGSSMSTTVPATPRLLFLLQLLPQ